MTPLLKQVLKNAATKTGEVESVHLKQTGRSYLSVFVLAAILLVTSGIFNPNVSLNERTYVAFVILLVFMLGSRVVLFALQKIASLATRNGPARARLKVSAPTRYLLAGGLLGFPVLLASLIIFQIEHRMWAVHYCAWGLLFFFVFAFIGLSRASRAWDRLFSKKFTEPFTHSVPVANAAAPLLATLLMQIGNAVGHQR
jgi:hypothetical protein